MILRDSVVHAGSRQISTGLKGEVVALSLDKGAYYGLDEVGSRIWAMIQEPKRVEDVCVEVVSEYEVDAGTCERDVIRFLTDLASVGLIEVEPTNADDR